MEIACHALPWSWVCCCACAQPVTPDSIVEESFSRSASERQLEELNRQGLPYEQYRLRRQRILGR